MHLFQKNVVSLWRALALHWHIHCWKEKTLEVYWVSKTAKNQAPKTDNQCSCMARTTVAVGARLLEVPRYHGDRGRAF